MKQIQDTDKEIVMLSNKIKIDMIDAEADTLQLSAQLDMLEAKEELIDNTMPDSVTVIIEGKEIFVTSTHYDDITVSQLIDIANIRKEEDALTQYLKKKYEHYEGVPIEMLEEETLLPQNVAMKWVKAELGGKKISFLPFEFVASMITDLNI